MSAINKILYYLKPQKRYYLVVLPMFFFVSCKPSKLINFRSKVSDWDVSYFLNPDTTDLRKLSFLIHVKAERDKKQTLYWFYQNRDMVHKSDANNMTAVTDYLLIYDSSFIFKHDKKYELYINGTKKIDAKPILISSLDSSVFKRVIELTDSLKLRNFHHLWKGKQFEIAGKRLK